MEVSQVMEVRQQCFFSGPLGGENPPPPTPNSNKVCYKIIFTQNIFYFLLRKFFTTKKVNYGMQVHKCTLCEK